MFCLFFTTVDGGDPEDSRTTGRRSRIQVAFTWVLVSLWCVLIAFAGISAFNPQWLQDVSEAGVLVESRDYKNFGDNLLRQEEYRRAIVQYREALERKPDYIAAMVNLAVCHMRLGEDQEGVQILRDAMKLEGCRRGVVYFNLAEWLEKQGKSAKAEEYYRRALGSEVDPVMVHQKMGGLYLAREEFGEARAFYESCLELQTDPAVSYQNMLQRSIGLYEEKEEHREVLQAHLERGVSSADLEPYDLTTIRVGHMSDPEIAKTHNHLGLIEFRLGDTTAAIGHFEKSLEIWPENVDARRNVVLLRRILREQGTADMNVAGRSDY